MNRSEKTDKSTIARMRLIRRSLVISGAVIVAFSALPASLLLEIAGWNPVDAVDYSDLALPFKGWGMLIGWALILVGVGLTLATRRRS